MGLSATKTLQETFSVLQPRPASPAKSEIRPHYRPDIDGLRAVAIFSVVAYHASERVLPGGFVGVDIFFVISGFLISSLIFKELDTGGFRFGDFYIRRVRRIFPALILMLTASLIGAHFVLTAAEQAQLDKHVAAGCAFVANLVQWLEAGYFDTDARLKPLLHLWSLGIEEQFYIFWPIAAVLLWRRRFGLVVLTLALLSFLFNIWRTPYHPVSAFYLPVGRAWELLLGSLLAYQQHQDANAGPRGFRFFSRLQFSIKDAASLVAVALLVTAFAAISPASQFPGWWALLPCIGAGLLIWAGETAWFNARILSHPLAVFIGLISYPLYLWHWPLLSFLRIVSSTEPPVAARLGAVAAAFLLAALTYRFVELPLRASRLPRGLMVATLSSAMLVVAAVGLYGYLHNQNAMPKRPPFAVSGCDPLMARDTPLYRYCRILGDPAQKKTFMLWGDSHANSWAVAIATVAQQKHARVIEISHPGCPPMLGVRRSLNSGQGAACFSFALANAVMDEIHKIQPEQIFLVARWSLYTKGLRSHGQLIENTFVTTDPGGEATPETSETALRSGLIGTLQQLSRISPVIVIKTVPTLHQPIDSGLARDPGGFEPSLSEYQSYEATPNALIDEAAKELPRVSVLDPAKILCAGKCRATRNGVRLYEDDTHLSDEGAMLFTPTLSRMVK